MLLIADAISRCMFGLRGLTLLLVLFACHALADVVDSPKVDLADSLCSSIQDNSVPAQFFLLQKQRALSSTLLEQLPSSVLESERQRPVQSPIQIFFNAHPSWLLAIIVFSILGSLGAMVWAVSWLLDQYEAHRWAAGQIGKPWYMDETMVMYVGAAALAMWIGIGMFLFTKIVHFFTPAGQDARLLTKSEAIYLCVQILTTVGYGDLTPSDTASQACVAAFILVGVVLVATVVTEFLKVLARRTERAIARMAHRHAEDEVERRSSRIQLAEASDEAEGYSESPRDDAEMDLTASILLEKEETLQQQTLKDRLRMLMDFLSSTAPFCLTLAVGTIFFSNYPGEDKTLWQAFYMSCVTLTTVGFGQFTAQTQGGKLFSALWMFVGVGATAHMVLCFSNAFLRRHREIQVNQLQYELLAEMDTDGDKRVDKCEFLRFELIRTGLCEKGDIDAILSRFNMLDLDQSGTIDIEDLKAIRHARVGSMGASRSVGFSRSSTLNTHRVMMLTPRDIS